VAEQPDTPQDEIDDLRVFARSRPATWGGSRSRRVIEAVAVAADEWRERALRRPPGELTEQEAERLLPRPQRLRVDWRSYTSPPRREREVFRAGPLRVTGRMLLWLFAAARLLGGDLGDLLLRRASVERRAQRLRRIMESMGGTFVKVGQQLSMRIDLIPYAMAHELEKMLDTGPSFPVEQAIDAIEQAAGKPLNEVYAVFDREPIASASIACVYQGVLKSGEKVGIKVRRPGIGQTFAADMVCLRVLLWFLEFWYFPPGYTEHIVRELRTMFMEELDFVREARFTELFRRRTKSRKAPPVTAPQVYPEISDHRVLVTDFVSGIFLTELLAAVENRDHRALGFLRQQDIDPKVVARRLIEVNRYSGFELLLFHADLHPGNVLVQPGNKLVLIDFGSCGSFTNQDRAIWRRVMQAQAEEDIGGMVQAAMAILEPLPPIDADAFRLELEELFWHDLYAIKSKHSPWYERTTANNWIAFLKLARKYHLPISLHVLRMIRVTMLSDTISLRLDGSINHYAEYRKYLKAAGKRAKKRLKERFASGIDDRTYVLLEQNLEALGGLVYRAQRAVDSSFFSYHKLQSKAAFFGVTFLRTGSTILLGTGVAMGIAALAAVIGEGLGQVPSGATLATRVAMSGWYQAFVAVVVLHAARGILSRLNQPET
jgi:ubiquinone biosynthesis protein